MRSLLRLGSVASALALSCGGAQPSTSFDQLSRAASARTLTGSLGGANYKIRVPDRWNGVLIDYAHGYRLHALYPGEPEIQKPDAAYRGAEMEDVLLARGYALAGSQFRENGWDVAEGIDDAAALAQYFAANIGQPRLTLLWGLSTGSAITLASIERKPDVYDGAIAGCVVGAGAPRTFDRAVDLTLSYKVTFGWPLLLSGTPGDLKGHAFFAADVLPGLAARMVEAKLSKTTFGKLEFMRLVNGAPVDGWYSPVITDRYNYSTPFLIFDMFYATEARAEMERRAGGPAAQNSDHHYSLSEEAKIYLAGLGVDADALLAEMNASANYQADPSARDYLKKYAEYTGQVRRPVLTIEDLGDGLTTPDGLSVLAETYRAAGTDALLRETFVHGVGHCNFTPEQIAFAADALVSWIDGGQRPADGDFPESLGFVHGYQPAPWPQPDLPASVDAVRASISDDPSTAFQY
jgi:hypothetical protein